MAIPLVWLRQSIADLRIVDFPKTVTYMHNMDNDPKQIGVTRRIGILPLHGFAAMSFAALTEPMRAANLLARDVLYDVVVFATADDPVTSSGAMSVTPDALVGSDDALEYLFVVAGGDPMAFEDAGISAWLTHLARAGVPLGGVSGGPVVLARAGLMKNRRMTVHWEHAGALSEMFPQLLLEKSLYVMDRDRVTCAGGSAPIDLMHALITQHHGVQFAQKVSDWFMHTDIRPSAGPQRAGLLDRVGNNTPAILDAVEAMEAHVAEPLSLLKLAQTAGTSPRQLNRLFSEKLGRSTMRYYRELRLDKAQSLLRNSPLTLTEIALATGFANSSHFSRAYAAQFGQPPSTYR